MRQSMASLFRRIGAFSSASQRGHYEKAVARVVVALDSGKLKGTDKASLATPIIDSGLPGWLSPLDGVDWGELHRLAKDNRMPLETVNDLLTVLQLAIGNM